MRKHPRYLIYFSISLLGTLNIWHLRNRWGYHRSILDVTTKQRVVLLVGPHKTSSTSEQVNILRWINSNRLPNWSWPLPNIDDNGTCNYETDPKVFGSYIRALTSFYWGSRCLHRYYRSQGLSREDLVSKYEVGFRNAWREGKKLIIASEMMDIIASEKIFRRNRFMSSVLHGMPWNSIDNTPNRLMGSNDDIIVVVNFRTPRVKHLMSMWHERIKDYKTFYEYLVVDRKDISALDSLMLANEFLNRGISVILVDMSGVAFEGYDVSNVIACDVLGAICNSKKRVIGDATAPEKKNMKYHPHNITDYQLKAMDDIIRRYDCSFINIINHENCTILYPKELMKISAECENISLSDKISKKSELAKKLSDVAKEVNIKSKDTS